MNVIYLNLPVTIHGFVARKVEADGEYETIVINARDGYEEQLLTYRHEMEHLRRGHFDDTRPVYMLENEVEHGQ